MVGTLSALAGLVIYLLVTHYQASKELRRAFLERLGKDAAGQAAALDSFFTARRNELRNLAGAWPVEVYFWVRASSTNENYGMNLAAANMRRLFEGFEKEKVGTNGLYTAVVLLDRDGNQVRAAGQVPEPDFPGKDPRRWLARNHVEGTFGLTPDQTHLRISLACEFKTAFAGQLLAWLEPGAVATAFRMGHPPQNQFLLLSAGDQRLDLPGLSASNVLARLRQLPPGLVAGQPHTIDVGQGRQQNHLVAFRLPLQARPLEFLTAFDLPAARLQASPLREFVALAAMFLFICGVAAWMLRLNTHAVVLQVRWQETDVRRREVEERNRLLESEIQERRRVEAALSRSEQSHREIFNATSDAIIVSDPDTGRILDANQAMLDIFGYTREEALRLGVGDVCLSEPPFDPATALSRIHGAVSEGPQMFEWRARHRDGHGFWVEVSLRCSRIGGQPCVLAVVRNIEERKRAEQAHQVLQQRFVQAQKMESVGRLAGGVAHDFNNLLTAILGNLDLLLEDKRFQDATLRESLCEIQQAGKRAAELTRQLLAFSRKQILQVQRVDLNQSIVNFGRMLRRMLGEDIKFATVLGPGLGLVKADPTQMEQVIMNLAVNARDAMPEGGKLTLETANLELAAPVPVPHVGVEPGAYVLLTMTDTGCGMDGATLQNIFEPFFTTKGMGRGTGLGLATVYGIVKQHDGFVTVQSEVGVGTTFRIYLPRVPDAAKPPDPPEVTPRPLPGDEFILVVEDDTVVRTLLCRMLTHYGYHVIEAKDELDAIRLAGEPGRIDLLLTDVIMPQLSGRRVYEEAVARRPGLKVLYTSGHPGRILAQQGLADEQIPFLQKPFTAFTLTTAIRKVLTS
jgi:PAS domain S-box-containing protein